MLFFYGKLALFFSDLLRQKVGGVYTHVHITFSNLIDCSPFLTHCTIQVNDKITSDFFTPSIFDFQSTIPQINCFKIKKYCKFIE